MRGVLSRKLGLVTAITLFLVIVFVVPAPAAPITATVPYSAAGVADADLDGNPATGSWSDAASWSIPLENGAAAPYGSATLYAKHDGTYIYFRVDGKMDVLWVSYAGNHFWFGVVFTSAVTSHHSTWQDGVFFGLDSFTSAPPLLAVDTNGGGKPPAKDAQQDDLGRMAASGSAAPYSFTAEWKRKLNTGDANDLAFTADGATSYYFYATSDSNGGGSAGGTINHKVTTNDNVIRFGAVSAGDTTPPTVSISSPANGAVVNGIVTVAATATDNVGVARVEFYADTTLLGTDSAAPYSQTWDTSAATQGTHQLTVKAFDAASNAGTATISVTVDHTARAVSLTAPANNSFVRGNVTINATATDPGGVSRVEFYVDATLLGSDTTSPYSWRWDTSASAEGSRQVTARVSFAAGGTMNATILVTVDRTPPRAEAGPTQSATTGTTVSLDGSGSTDANAVVNWTWTVLDTTGSQLFGSTISCQFLSVGAFQVWLDVVDPAGNRGNDSTWVNVTARDTTPPGPLGMPEVSSMGAGEVQVSWSASSAPDVAGYSVLRADAEAGPFIQVNAQPVSSTSYLDTGLQPGQTYYYEVVAVDRSGNPSTPSPGAPGVAGADPPAPLDLVSLRWVLVPGATGAAMGFLGVLAWREERRKRGPKQGPPTEGNP